MAMHKAEQERLTRTTETHCTKVVGIDLEVIDADIETLTESDIQKDEIRNFGFKNRENFQFQVSTFLKPVKSQIPKSENLLTVHLIEQQNDKLTTSQSLDSKIEKPCGNLR